MRKSIKISRICSRFLSVLQGLASFSLLGSLEQFPFEESVAPSSAQFRKVTTAESNRSRLGVGATSIPFDGFSLALFSDGPP